MLARQNASQVTAPSISFMFSFDHFQNRRLKLQLSLHDSVCLTATTDSSFYDKMLSRYTGTNRLLCNSQHPLPLETEEPILADAIDNLSASRLREMIKDMCVASHHVREDVEKRLLILKENTIIPPPFKDEDDSKVVATNAVAETNMTKLKRERVDGTEEEYVLTRYKKQRFENCVQCACSYDVTTNRKDICEWHPGELEEGEDPIYDEDEDTNKVWSCCGEPDESVPCTRSWHRYDRSGPLEYAQRVVNKPNGKTYRR